MVLIHFIIAFVSGATCPGGRGSPQDEARPRRPPSPTPKIQDSVQAPLGTRTCPSSGLELSCPPPGDATPSRQPSGAPPLSTCQTPGAFGTRSPNPTSGPVRTIPILQAGNRGSEAKAANRQALLPWGRMTPEGPRTPETLGCIRGARGGSYLTPPVVLWDGDVAAARAAGRGQPVVLGRQVGEVAVQVQVLRVLPPTCPPVVAGTLNTPGGVSTPPRSFWREARGWAEGRGQGCGFSLASRDELGSCP